MAYPLGVGVYGQEFGLTMWWVEVSAGGGVSDVRPNGGTQQSVAPAGNSNNWYLHLERVTGCAGFGFSGYAVVVCATSED